MLSLLRIIASILQIFVILGISFFLLDLQLEIDQNYGVFAWIESPSHNPFRDAMGMLFSSVFVWLLIKSYIKRSLVKNPIEGGYEAFFIKLQKVLIALWYLPPLLVSVLLIQNPPAKVTHTHKVKILKIHTDKRSKPYTTYYTLESWRGEKHETLSTHILEWKHAKKLKVSVLVSVQLGKDWLGRERVLRVKEVLQN